MKNKNTNNVTFRSHLLIPILTIQIIIILFLGYAINSYIQNKSADFTSDHIKSIDKLFKELVYKDAQLIRALINNIQKDKATQRAWLNKNREQLLKISTPLFNQIKKNHKITHFYFHNLDKTNFIRIHNSQKHGDDIDRFTMIQAHQSHQSSFGIELGVFGIFTLRYVYPWYINNKLEGYIELGEEIEHITERLRLFFNSDITFLIKKEYLDRKMWEQGLKILKRKGDWSNFKDVVITNSSFNNFNIDIKDDLIHNHINKYAYEHFIKSENRYLQLAFIALLDVGNKKVGDILLLKDITAQKNDLMKTITIMISSLFLFIFSLDTILWIYLGRLDIKLKNAKNDLNLKIEELKGSQKQLQKAKDAKDEFLANMSHEIRTPMNAIIGMSQFLLGSNATTEQVEYIDIINSSSTHLLQLINDILDYSKIEANKIIFEEVIFDLKGTINDSINTVKHLAKDIDLKYSLDHNIKMKLIGDPSRLRQILINLCNNAIKFTKEGEVKLSVKLEKDDTNSSTIRFEIIDTGIGISLENQNKLFKKFSQADSSTTREFGGTGLGLAISKSLVERMGGTIGVISKEGIGSTFWFILTFHNSNNSNKIIEPEYIPATNNNITIKNTNLKVLLAEDNKINQIVIIKMLNKSNIQNIDTVSTGLEVIDAIKENYYDLILMDVMMPELGGIETTLKIRDEIKNKDTIKNKNIKIVAITAKAMKGDRKECIDAGMDDYISKPIEMNKLKAVINKLNIKS